MSEINAHDYLIPTGYQDVVESLALYIRHDLPTLITGAVGCGKSALLRHVASQAGRTKSPQLVTIQLCKDLDGRSLLGAYHCTDVGGEFKWIPGLLTTAVLSSSWVILEDIDNAAVDALSILLPLIQSRTLQVAELGKTLRAGPDFRLFATLRTHESRNIQNYRVDTVLLSQFKRLHLPTVPNSDIFVISNTLFPKLSLILPRLLQVLELASQPESCDDPKVRAALLSRFISVRDFFKLCRRISSYVLSSSMDQIESIFLDIFTCFAAFISDSAVKIRLARLLGEILGLPNSDVDYYISKRKPEIDNRDDCLKIGRLNLSVIPVTVADDAAPRNPAAVSLHPSVLRLMENLASCISSNEAALLVGETGAGKTTLIQYLAERLGRKLHVINLSHQAETSDLFGGYKPVEFRSQMFPLMENFLALFSSTFSTRGNESFLTNCKTAFGEKNWKTLVGGMRHIADSAKKRFLNITQEDMTRLQQQKKWEDFSENLAVIEKQLSKHQRSLIFAFLEGTLVKSFRVGDWVLLDEINLATPELLAGLHCFMDSTCQSFVLSDRGDTEDIQRHPDFRLFACMNPATDVGKRELPADVRSRFTELYCDELTDIQEIHQVVQVYLQPLGLGNEGSAESRSLTEIVANLHVELKALADKSLMDGVGHKPHYSLRTFTQALRYAAKNPMGHVRRSLYEGFNLSYLTQLNRLSQALVKSTIAGRLLLSADGVVPKFVTAPRPQSGKVVQIEGYYVECGKLEPVVDDKYIMTETVKSNLAEIARAVSAGRIPVLLQGETSIGKTSLITWLAKATGNKCVRINNHEFTDLQDYIGTYQTNTAGKLVFVEGMLVNAVRKGFWIILDELNLAPSDVLEALNRLLDSNRELFIPEKQEVIRAHPQFMLFATQNPPGYYGGRKTLSRAFRNRFIEMHFDEIPPVELQTILQKRCALPPTYSKKIVDVMLELQARRKMSGIFAGKQGFMTLRDLFRWAERYRLAEVPAEGVFYNWTQHLADHGFLLLAGRVRKAEEVNDIKVTLEKHFKTVIDSAALFGSSSSVSLTTEKTIAAFAGCGDSSFSHIVWTSNLRRMVALAGTALAYGEPVLLVGETGCGKTTISQIYACLRSTKLFAVGCHMNTETSDFLGGLRPARPEDKEASGLFLWKDGPLVEAMEQGGVFLMDEISLAADSVLERMNSVLEPERQLILTEKGSSDADTVPLTVALPEFRLVATMNPGGDFGKKELSPALRNRFTEIWCDNLDVCHDLKPLLEHNLFSETELSENAHLKGLIETAMVGFVNWFLSQCPRVTITGRDVMSWINFMNRYLTDGEDTIVFAAVRHPVFAYFHGTCMVFENIVYGPGFGSPVVGQFLQHQLSDSSFSELVSSCSSLLSLDLISEPSRFGLHPFVMTRRNGAVEDRTYDFTSVSVRRSLLRILRGCMVAKGILLEGPPGVGKTSIVKALAAAIGHTVVRINLSEQTDISELFGSDMPLEGTNGTSLFAWRDGPFLDALRKGSWILLDELNLASQSVLEGLNACLDHRGEIYIPELNRSFKIDTKTTRIFACQNPLFQGSGRKGLPKSFLNRFTQVYIDELLYADLLSICQRAFPSLPNDKIAKLLSFNQAVQSLVSQRKIGSDGQPWEFNLRDVIRWCGLFDACAAKDSSDRPNEAAFVDLLYVSRFRSEDDRRIVSELAVEMGIIPGGGGLPRRFLKTEVTRSAVTVGSAVLPRTIRPERSERVELFGQKQLLQSQSGILEKLSIAVSNAFPVILVGPQGTAKTSLIQLLAALTGNHLEILSMNSETDASDLLGGFEQNNWQRDVGNATRSIDELSDYFPGDDSINISLKETGAALSLALTRVKDSTTSPVISSLKKAVAELNQLGVPETPLQEMVARTIAACQRAALSLESTKKGRFEWCDSLVVKALLEGSWLLVDNANLCNPAVLDRLNSVLEPNGDLFVPERGDGEASLIRAHPNFRLFMTTNPKYGELSRAMRNRGIEIFVPVVLHDRDCLALLGQIGLSEQIAGNLLQFLHKITPLKALSWEDVHNVGREVWMRLSENASLQVALQKAVSHSASFPEDCSMFMDNLTAVLMNSGSELPVHPYAVTVRGLLQDRIGTNVARHRSSLETVASRVPHVLNSVLADYALPRLMDGSEWTRHLLLLVDGVFLSQFSVEDWNARLVVAVQSARQNRLLTGEAITNTFKFLGQLFESLQRDYQLFGLWLRSCLSWTASACYQCPNDLAWEVSFETEKVRDFFGQFALWMMESTMNSRHDIDFYRSETAQKLAVTGIWFHSLQSLLSDKHAATSHGCVSVIWRLFSQHILQFLSVKEKLPGNLLTQSRHFDEDFRITESAARVLIRKCLVQLTPFSDKEQFLAYNKLLMAMTSEAVAEMSPASILSLLHNRTASLHENGAMLSASISPNKASEISQFWPLLQLEFLQCEPRTSEIAKGLLCHWTAFPHVVKELLLTFCKSPEMLSPLDTFSLKFSLLPFSGGRTEKASENGKESHIAHEIMLTCPSYLWWRELLQLVSVNGQIGSAKLGSFDAQLFSSQQAERHLWRKINAKTSLQSVLELDRQTIADHLKKGLESSLPQAVQDMTSDGMVLSEWERLFDALRVLDPTFSQLGKEVFGAMTGYCPTGGGTNFGDMAWISTGIITMTALFPLFVDPVEEQLTTRNCLRFQAIECEASLQLTETYFHDLYGSANPENFDAELMTVHQQQLSLVKSTLNNADMRVLMFRPEPSLYHALVQDGKGLRDVVVRRTWDVLKYEMSDDVAASKHSLGQLSATLSTLTAMTVDLRRKYFAYRDMLEPFLAGVRMVLFGLGGIIRTLQRKLTASAGNDSTPPADLLRPLTRIFSLSEKECTTYYTTARAIWKQRKAVILLYKAKPEDRLLFEIRLILLTLRLLRLHAVHVQYHRPSIALRDAVFMRFAVIWHDIEQVKRKVEEEKAQLYKFAADENQRAQDTAFPSYQQDLDNLSTEMEALEMATKRGATHQKFMVQVQSEIVDLHGELVRGNGGKPPGTSPYSGISKAHVNGVISLSLDIGCGFVSSFPELFEDDSMDATSFLLQSYNQRETIETGISKTTVNFYYDSHIHEAKKCVPVVKDVKLRVDELLAEWPSHPVLNEISITVERLLNFQLSEPLAKLLMALELIMDKCQHWEAKAHSGVSLQPQMESLGDLVVQWRKLELSQWENALGQVVREKAKKAARWWLLVFTAVMETMADDAKPDAVVALVKVLQKFVESSPLGEYRARLDLIDATTLHFMPSGSSHGIANGDRQSHICAVLRNLHTFYSQFIVIVESSIVEQRKPIEKELKNFIHVARWNDMNYWSLKHTIQKAHRTIHKHMKQLESILEQPVVLKRPVLTALSIRATPGSRSILGVLPQLPSESGLPRLTNVIPYLRKCRRITRQICTSFDRSAKLIELDEISEEYWDRFRSFKEPSLDLPSEKRKEATKNMIKGKRLAFTDLTKLLKALGISARKGLALPSTPDAAIAAFESSFINLFSSEFTRDMAEKCQALFWSNVSNLSVFRRLLESPCKDLDSRFVGLMKGFTEHLHRVILDQIREVFAGALFNDHLDDHVRSARLSERLDAPSGKAVQSLLGKGSDILRDILVTLDKHLLMLDSVPKKDSEQSQTAESVLDVVYGQLEDGCFRSDHRWTELRNSIIVYRQLVADTFTSLKTVSDAPLHTFGKSEIEDLETVVKFCVSSRDNLAGIADIAIPVSRGALSCLIDRMDNFVKSWSIACSLMPADSTKIPTSTERVLIECLKAFQTSLTVCHSNSDKQIEVTTGCPAMNLNDGSLRLEFDALNIPKLFRTIQLLVKQINASSCGPRNEPYLLISRSFLETYTVLLHNKRAFGFRLLESSNRLLQLVLSIFTDILENGFGKVEDVEEGPGQENGHEKFEESEQAGLGDGEGAKDVSDQIESEDQLEDTKTPGMEEKEKQNDEKIADEEHGVEMTDDFEGAIDYAPKEELGSDEEDDEADSPEVDDQMGDLDGDSNDLANDLDKKFWDKDDEDDEPNSDEDNADEPEKKESAEGQGVDEEEKVDLAPKDNTLSESAAKDDQQPMKNGEDNPDAGETEEQGEDVPSGDGPDMDIPENMEIDDDEPGVDQENSPEDDANVEDNKDESDLPETGEDDKAQSTQATEPEKDSDVLEIPEDDALKAPSTVPPSDKNESDVGTDGAGVPADMDYDQNPDAADQNNNDVNTETAGMSTAASGRKTNDESGHDVDARLPQGQPPLPNKPSTAEKRTLEPAGDKKKTPGNRNESYRKRLKISQADNQQTMEKQQKSDKSSADMYEHVVDESEPFDDQVVDAASKAESQQNSDRLQMEDEDMPDDEENMTVDDLESDEKLPEQDTTENPPILFNSKKDPIAGKKEDLKKNQATGAVDIPGEVVETLGALPEHETFYGSQLALLESFAPKKIDTDALRKELVQDMMTWSGGHFDSSERTAMDLWRKYEAITEALSRELCEQLRLVLEPTKKSKLKGDYRTGKRLNMRKVVAYVASDFRKDKIWLRRTQPSQRQYQVLIAVDDSSSMADNQTKELAFESLAVLSNALTVLEVGELSICSFGEGVSLLHPFQVPFSSSDGARVLTKFSFAQKKTNIAEMVELVTGVFDESRSRLLNVTNVSQLLLIVSDGRGIFREGVEVVKQAVRRMVNQGVFTVFVILDNPSESHKQGSILDIRVPVFGGQGQGLELRNYMQDFPFPFYLVLRNVKELPSTLCDALRQWFEMISSRD